MGTMQHIAISKKGETNLLHAYETSGLQISSSKQSHRTSSGIRGNLQTKYRMPIL